MQLYMSPYSPFARMVRITARELRVVLEEIEVQTNPHDSVPELTLKNPLGQIPTLVRDDGPSLFDGRVICRYLNDQASGLLYPQTRLYDLLTLEALAYGMADAAVSMAYEVKFRPPQLQSSDWLEAQWSEIDRGLGALQSHWIPLLNGPVNIGQISVAAVLGYLDLRHDARKWRESHEALANWAAKFAERPSFVRTGIQKA